MSTSTTKILSCSFSPVVANIFPVGVTYVDYENDQKRYPKKSAKSLKPLFDSLIEK